jgi:hypothetical protein
MLFLGSAFQLTYFQVFVCFIGLCFFAGKVLSWLSKVSKKVCFCQSVLWVSKALPSVKYPLHNPHTLHPACGKKFRRVISWGQRVHFRSLPSLSLVRNCGAKFVPGVTHIHSAPQRLRAEMESVLLSFVAWVKCHFLAWSNSQLALVAARQVFW